MYLNKKILYGDRHPTSINEDSKAITTPGPPPEGKFTFDSMEITFDTLMRTFDEI
jgi:hypothetical protein